MAHSFQLKWTHHALARIEAIKTFVAPHDPAAAQKLAGLIRGKAEILRWFPYQGREVIPCVRELVVHRRYRIMYRAKLDYVEILQVWHVAQDR